MMGGKSKGKMSGGYGSAMGKASKKKAGAKKKTAAKRKKM